MKLPLFVASSRESLDVANAINRNLDSFADVTVWKNWAFPSLESTLVGLREAMEKNYFGIFVAAPDDISIIRGQTLPTVRDNVIFELGLFIGRHGPAHCFVVCPQRAGAHLPSDILGATVYSYDADRFKKEPDAAMNPATSSIELEIQKRAIEERLATGLYFGTEHKEFTALDWKSYVGKPMSLEVDRNITFPGSMEDGWRHPPDRDSLRAPGKTFAFRIRAESEVRVYPFLELAGGKKLTVKINTRCTDWGIHAGENEYRVPLPPDFPRHWKVVVVDLESIARGLGTSVLRLTGLRVRGGVVLSHIWCLNSFNELPSQFQKDATLLRAVGGAPLPLEVKIRALCRTLKAFLKEHGLEPSTDVVSWRLKFQGDYKVRFADNSRAGSR